METQGNSFHFSQNKLILLEIRQELSKNHTYSTIRYKTITSAEHIVSDLYSLNPSKIVMYSTEYCGDCRRAKAFFDAKQIQYLNVGLEGNEDATNFVINLNNGSRSVPTIVFPDGSVLVEPSWEELERKTSQK